MSDNKKSPASQVPAKPKKKASKTLLLIAGIIVGGLTILALGATAVYYFFFRIPSPQTVEPADIPEIQLVAGPDVLFMQPTSGTFVETGDSFMVLISAQDIERVSRLDLWINDTLAISLPSPDPAGITPLILSHPLVASEAGTYSLVARAYNTLGGMTESPAVTVFVSEPAAGAAAGDAANEPIQYIVKDGDTLQSIADKTSNSVAGIQAVNRGIQNVKPGQNIAIPHPPLPKPPQQPPIGAIPGAGANQPGAGNIGALPGLLPALPPGGIQANLPSIDQGQQLLPNILPDRNQILNPSSSLIKAPQLIQIIIAGCKIEITWEDNSDNETGFAIYRRQVPNDATAKIVGRVGANETSFEDIVPFPAKYQYYVEAVGSMNALPGQQVANAARSAPATRDVLPSANCIAPPAAAKHLYFVLNRVYTNDPNFIGMSLWFSINDSSPRRIPSNQGNFPHPNNIGASSSSAYVPLPTSVYMDPDQPIIVKIWAAAHTKASWEGDEPGPADLGRVVASHTPKDIEPKDGTYLHRFEFGNKDFGGEYSIALTDKVYGGDFSSAQLPSPTNLKLAENPIHNFRNLTWEWNGDPTKLEGYMIYRSYSCIGQETEVRAPTFTGKALKGYDIPMLYEPQGCSYSYRVSALGKLGESKPSEALTGKTQNTFGVVYVTYKEVKIWDIADGPQSGSIHLQAGHIVRESNPMWLEKDTYDAASLYMEGKSPNNTFTVVLSPVESLSLSFTVSGIAGGKTNFNSICGKAIVVAPSNWNKSHYERTFTSNDGTCEATVEISAVPPAAGTSGQRALPQADLEILSLATIGNEVYANVYNNGPQDLQATKIIIFNTWGTGACGGKILSNARVDGPYNYQYFMVDIKSKAAIWLHLSQILDDNFEYFSTGKGAAAEGCYNFVYTSVEPLGTHDMLITPEHIDENPGNNEFRIRMLDIQPMR